MDERPITIFWFRRDLRLSDNSGLYYALKEDLPVLPLFIFDSNILDDIEDKHDPRVTFIHKELHALHKKLIKVNSGIAIRIGSPLEIWKSILKEFNIKKVVANHDYEPYSISRDNSIKQLLLKQNIEFKTFKDQVIMEKNDVLKPNGKPYVVFTPYSIKWKEKVDDSYLRNYEINLEDGFLKFNPGEFPELSTIGFKISEYTFFPKSLDETKLEKYVQLRDFPAEDGTSKIGMHLRFGTVSIRRVTAIAKDISEKFLNELIWRDFYQMILWHFPHVITGSFNSVFDNLPWRNNEKEFELWKLGKTGYPMVDAGMRELKTTGYMHNRVRMVTASFLTKHLLIDWRWGEAYFAGKLLDYELASNNGGWQWAAGTGVDAAPYFRVFNPTLQEEKFDPERKYIRKWVPEYGTSAYPKPIVEHKIARERAIKTYKDALNR